MRLPWALLQEGTLSEADAGRLLDYFAAAVPAGLQPQDIAFLKALPLYPTISAARSSGDAPDRVAVQGGCATCAADVLAAVVGQADALPASVRVSPCFPANLRLI